MPTFCRHNRLIQNCAICSREMAVEPRPVLSSSAPKVNQPRPATPGVARQRGGSVAHGVRRRDREAASSRRRRRLPYAARSGAALERRRRAAGRGAGLRRGPAGVARAGPAGSVRGGFARRRRPRGADVAGVPDRLPRPARGRRSVRVDPAGTGAVAIGRRTVARGRTDRSADSPRSRPRAGHRRGLSRLGAARGLAGGGVQRRQRMGPRTPLRADV